MTGTICSVAVCKSNAIQAKKSGEHISFFSFPKDKVLRKKWIQLCNRKDKFNPVNKRVCSKHFTPQDFEDELYARLLSTTPKKLKQDAVPSIKLRAIEAARSQSKRRKRAERKTQFTASTSPEIYSDDEFETDSTSMHHEMPSVSNQTNSQALSDVLKSLKAENEALKQKLVEKEKQRVYLNKKNMELEKTILEHETSNKLVQEILSEFLTPNQINIILKKKSRPHWTSEELCKGYTLRFLSEKAYNYVRETLKYPLPDVSTLERWASNEDIVMDF